MADAVITHFRPVVGVKHPIEKVVLIPSGGGVFDVKVDGNLIFSKHELHRHAEHAEIIESIKELMR